MTSSYNPTLVALSILIAIAASYATLDVAGRVAASLGRHRLAWLIGGSTAMGTGIWAMHYIGMLAFVLPVPVQYDWPIVLLSWLVAVISSLVALSVVSHKTLGLRRLAVASILMGSGIAGMHYIGMKAMRLQAVCHWSRPLVALSLVVGVAISFVALRFAFYFRDDRPRRPWRKLASAVFMGSSIPVMHYTGMAAVRFSSGNVRPDDLHAISISSLGIISIAAVSFMTLGLTLLLALLDRRFTNQARELANSEQRYRELIESARVVLWRSDSDLQLFSFVSSEVETLLGYPTAHWLEKKFFWRDHLHPDDCRLVAALRAESAPNVILPPLEHRMLAASGATVWVRTSLRIVESIAGLQVIGLMLDITERKRAEEALEQERRLFEALMDASPDCIYFKDLESRFVRVNRAQANLFSLPEPGLAVGKTDADFFSSPHSQQALADERKIIATHQPLIDCEEQETWPDGRVTWVSTTKMPRLEADGSVGGTIGISRSITERKLIQERLGERTQQLIQSNTDLKSEISERHLLEGQLVQAQKLESIGQLAAGIAHEINTPIQYVSDNCRFLEDSFQNLARILDEFATLLDAGRKAEFAPAVVHMIETSMEDIDLPYLIGEIPLAVRQCIEGTDRVAVIVRAMKEFSHPGSKEMRLADLNRAVENTLIVCRNEWKLVADTVTDLDPLLPPVCCLADELNQVLLNLVVNAAHAIADAKKGEIKGRITVSTRQDGHCVEIRVQDDGVGIPEAIQSRIFDPFFTTKEVGRGTGQGLAISRNVIVTKHHGSLTFETTPNVGTVFIARFPIDGNPAHEEQKRPELAQVHV